MKWCYISSLWDRFELHSCDQYFHCACVCVCVWPSKAQRDMLIKLNGEYFMSDDDEIERGIDRIWGEERRVGGRFCQFEKLPTGKAFMVNRKWFVSLAHECFIVYTINGIETLRLYGYYIRDKAHTHILGTNYWHVYFRFRLYFFPISKLLLYTMRFIVWKWWIFTTNNEVRYFYSLSHSIISHFCSLALSPPLPPLSLALSLSLPLSLFLPLLSLKPKIIISKWPKDIFCHLSLKSIFHFGFLLQTTEITENWHILAYSHRKLCLFVVISFSWCGCFRALFAPLW